MTPHQSNAKSGWGSLMIDRRFRGVGRIKAAIWENEADQKKFYNVTFARVYTGDDNQPHDADNFGRDDLPLVAKLADRAHTYIFERLAGARAEGQGE